MAEDTNIEEETSISERRRVRGKLNHFLHFLQKARIVMWVAMWTTVGLCAWWTYWLTVEGHIFNLNEWQLATGVAPIYLALVSIIKLCIDDNRHPIHRDHD